MVEILRKTIETVADPNGFIKTRTRILFEPQTTTAVQTQVSGSSTAIHPIMTGPSQCWLARRDPIIPVYLRPTGIAAAHSMFTTAKTYQYSARYVPDQGRPFPYESVSNRCDGHLDRSRSLARFRHITCRSSLAIHTAEHIYCIGHISPNHKLYIFTPSPGLSFRHNNPTYFPNDRPRRTSG
jgi:hypothetical protein